MSTEEQRQAREAELVAMLETGDGRFELLDLFEQMGIALAVEADLRTEIIPAILQCEFPDLPSPRLEPADDQGLDDLRRSNPR